MAFCQVKPPSGGRCSTPAVIAQVTLFIVSLFVVTFAVAGLSGAAGLAIDIIFLPCTGSGAALAGIVPCSWLVSVPTTGLDLTTGAALFCAINPSSEAEEVSTCMADAAAATSTVSLAPLGGAPSMAAGDDPPLLSASIIPDSACGTGVTSRPGLSFLEEFFSGFGAFLLSSIATDGFIGAWFVNWITGWFADNDATGGAEVGDAVIATCGFTEVSFARFMFPGRTTSIAATIATPAASAAQRRLGAVNALSQPLATLAGTNVA